MFGGGHAHAHAQQDDVDPELRAVFLAELAEVTQSLQRACTDWHANPYDKAALKNLRRGFHTIKGSAPLIGASALSDFSRQLEHLTAQLLEKPTRATSEMVTTVEQAIALLPDFATAARTARPPPPQAGAISHKVRLFLN